jgi:hypothetical protein
MSGRRRTLAVLLLVAVVVCLAALILPAMADQRFGQSDVERQVRPASNQYINYPAFPSRGGPHIIAATHRWWAAGGDVFIVFDEDLDATVNLTYRTNMDDNALYPTGFTYTGITVSGNTVSLTGVGTSVLPANAAIRIARAGTLRAHVVHPVTGVVVDQSYSSDVSNFPIGIGPVITNVTVARNANVNGDDDEITVTFDSEVSLVTESAAGVTTAFGSTTEFNGASLTSNHNTGNFTSVTITRASGNSFLRIMPGVTKLILVPNQIEWNQPPYNLSNSARMKVPVLNAPPHLVAAYYDGHMPDPIDHTLYLVMSQPIYMPPLQDPTTDFTTHFTPDPDDGGNWSIADTTAPTFGVIFSPFSNDWTTCIKVSGMSGIEGPPDGVNDMVGMQLSTLAHPDYAPKNYQLLGATAADQNRDVLIQQGPGIIRTSIDTRQSNSPAVARLYVWLAENMATPGSVITTDFEARGFDISATGVLVEVANPGSPDEVLIFSGFTAGNVPQAGDRILPSPGSASHIIGSSSGAPIPRTYWMPVVDESRPYTVRINPDPLSGGIWNYVTNPLSHIPAPGDIDSVYIAWTEDAGSGNPDDSDQYFMFISSRDGDVDAPVIRTMMYNYPDQAIPLGNVRPGQSGDNIKVCLPLTILDGTPTDYALGTDPTDRILFDGDFWVYVSAADFQGNLAWWGDPPNSIKKFGPFRLAPADEPSFAEDHLPGNPGLAPFPGQLTIGSLIPNPTTGRSTVRFGVPRSGEVTLQVFDAGGRLVRTLWQGHLARGWRQAEWDGCGLRGPAAAGVYWLRLTGCGGVAQARRIVIVR